MAATASSKRKQQQRQAIFRLLVLAAILVCLNLLASRFHKALDLTQEKRFTLSPSTVKMLKGLDEVAVVDVYLKGNNFPATLKRLADATRERLLSFQEIAGNRVVFRFINPLENLEGKSDQEKMGVLRELASKGIFGGSWQQQQDAAEGYQEKTIFPWALVTYKGQSKAVNLVENHMGMSEDEVVNASETLLEYKLANAIHELNRPAKPTIAYIMGNGESLGYNTFDMLKTLAANYRVDTFDMSVNFYIPGAYSAIIINKPTIPFSDKDKFKIDQYVMNGGKVLWCLDMLNTTMDSLQHSESFVTEDFSLNLDDLLFQYGVRVNNNLIEDLRCAPVPVVVGRLDDGSPDIRNRPWMYFPIFLPTSKHPVVNNMDAVLGRFVNSIDTIGENQIRKTVLLESSQYSRVSPSPVRVSLSMMRYPPKPALFHKPFQPAAVLLEGRFSSVFLNRLPPQFLRILRDSLKHEFKPIADVDGSMIVIGDGDIFDNDFNVSSGPYEMGYLSVSKMFFANKTFLLNCMEYLTDPGGPLEARSKNLTLRLLDKDRVKREQTKWQIINIAVPLALVLVFAAIYSFFRKRRYEGI